MTCCNHNCRQGRDCPNRPQRTWRGLWVALVASLGLSGCVGHNPSTTVADAPRILHVDQCDPGGMHADRINRYMMPLEQAGTRVIIDSPCLSSAGTYYLALPNSCITPRVVARFHGPVDVAASMLIGLPGLGVPARGEDADIARAEMLDMFRRYPAFQRWLAEGLHQTRFRSLDYAQLRGFGFPACGAAETEWARTGRVTLED